MKASPIFHCTLALFAIAWPANAQEAAPPTPNANATAIAQTLSGPLSLEDSIRIALATLRAPL